MQEIMNLAEQEILSLREKIKLLVEEKQLLVDELNLALRKPFKPNIKKEEVSEDKKETKKKGAPVGHRGGTRKKPTRIDLWG